MGWGRHYDHFLCIVEMLFDYSGTRASPVWRQEVLSPDVGNFTDGTDADDACRWMDQGGLLWLGPGQVVCLHFNTFLLISCSIYF